MIDIIHKKRNGKILNWEEIDYFVKNYNDGKIPEYQMSALLMAIFFQGMKDSEIFDLTRALTKSGVTIDVNSSKKKIDKHSTGGVGDGTSLVLAPLVSSCDILVPMLCGRGLGHTGGTIDKLESIPGLRTGLSFSEFVEVVRKHKVAIISQTEDIAPVDGRLYALRDVTGCVDSIPLIVSSIMSKKLAIKTDGIVLDVKWGRGAFMNRYEDALALAKLMVEIATRDGREVEALVTDMNQPLGSAVGNALEVKQAIQILSNNEYQIGMLPSVSNDFLELVLELGSRMVLMAGRAENLEESRSILKEKIESGEALGKFKELIVNQGGNGDVVHSPDRFLPMAEYQIEIKSEKEGYIRGVDACLIGRLSMLIGAGRKFLTDEIDYSVGIILLKKLCQYVRRGETLGILHLNRESDKEKVESLFLEAYDIGDEKPAERPLVRKIVN